MTAVPVHQQVLEAAARLAGKGRTFRLREIVRALPHLNPGTVRTHVASRCCVNAPAHHATRWRYFRKVRRGLYRLERTVAPASRGRLRGWQDRIFERGDSGIDPTLIAESLKWTPTERLERMRAAALSIEAMRPTLPRR